MCGVVGYIGKGRARPIISESLSRLEYRGYDSSGYACINAGGDLLAVKAIGYLNNLIQKLAVYEEFEHVGIGHTRWATHGEISECNAHPQLDCFSNVAVVHNGIIENHLLLKQELISKGHVFKSQTDTEVLAHLCESLNEHKLKAELMDFVCQLDGAFASIILNKNFPDKLIAIRKGSPLCIGIVEGEFFVASDPYAFATHAKNVLFLPDETFAILTLTGIEIFNFKGDSLSIDPIALDINEHNSKRDGYEHYMLKEIFEQKQSIQATLSHYKGTEELILQCSGLTEASIVGLRGLTLIGCGTSWHAGRIAQFFFEQIAQLPTKVMLASEFRYSSFFPESNTCYIGISQSGETIDTLECLRLIKLHGLRTMALTNVPLSSMTREASGYLLTKAGQEISVASTKAFSTQLTALFWLANFIAFKQSRISQYSFDRAVDDLLIVSEVLENLIVSYHQEIIDTIAPFYAQFKKFIFLGRHVSYPFAMEAALKLKEVAYIFSQCYPAGELKHGPIALLDQETPVVLFSNIDPQIYAKILSSAKQVKARKAHVLVFAFEGQDELIELADKVFIIPKVHQLLGPLAMTGVMQVLVYEIAKHIGCPIDKPRNLAKSVTVE